MAITEREADEGIEAFANEFRGIAALKFIHRPTQEDFYGKHATIGSAGKIRGAFLPRSQEVHLPLANLRDGGDLRTSLQHEVLGHYATLTFSAAQKHALLDAVSAGRGSVSLKEDWAKVDAAYGSLSESRKAEEVFCLAAERSRGLPSQLPSDGSRIWSEVVRDRLRPLEREDLQTIVDLVADGIRRGTRTQQIFPLDNDSQFSAAASSHAAMRDALPVLEPQGLDGDRSVVLARAFRDADALDGLKAHPELAGAYALMAVIGKQLEGDGLASAQHKVVLAQVRENLAARLERGERPAPALRSGVKQTPVRQADKGLER